jgi:hypothetical protein
MLFSKGEGCNIPNRPSGSGHGSDDAAVNASYEHFTGKGQAHHARLLRA